MNEPVESHETFGGIIAGSPIPAIPTRRPKRKSNSQNITGSESNGDENCSQTSLLPEANEVSSGKVSKEIALGSPREIEELKEERAEGLVEETEQPKEKQAEGLPQEKMFAELNGQNKDDSKFVETAPGACADKQTLDSASFEDAKGLETETGDKTKKALLDSAHSLDDEAGQKDKLNISSAKQDVSSMEDMKDIDDKHKDTQNEATEESTLASPSPALEDDLKKFVEGPNDLLKSSKPEKDNNRELGLEKKAEPDSIASKPKRAPPPVRPKPSSKIAAFQKMLQQQQEEEMSFKIERPASASRPHSFLNRKTSSSLFSPAGSSTAKEEDNPTAKSRSSEESLEKNASSNPFLGVNKNPNFVSNLNGILAGGFGGTQQASAPTVPQHRPTRTNTSASSSSISESENVSNEDPNPENEGSNLKAGFISKSKEKDSLVDTSRTRRARGPKGRKLPSKLQNVAKVKLQATNNIFVFTNWKVSFDDSSNTKKLTEEGRKSTEQQLDEILDGYVDAPENPLDDASEGPLPNASEGPLLDASEGPLSDSISEGFSRDASSKNSENANSAENLGTQENDRDYPSDVSSQQENNGYSQVDIEKKEATYLNSDNSLSNEEVVDYDKTATDADSMQGEKEKDETPKVTERFIPKVPSRRPVKHSSDVSKVSADSF